MNIDVFTLFPEWFDWFSSQRHVRNVLELGSSLQCVNIRDHTTLSGGQVDDTPFGGGAGMVLRVDVLDSALRAHYGVDPVELATQRRVIALALAHACALADAVAQVVQLGPANVAARGQLDALDLGGVQREHALDADPEGLLAHGERLANAMALALDDDPLEDLHAPARTLDDLEVNLHAVARGEAGYAAQLRALDGFDDAAHNGEGGARPNGPREGPRKLSAGATGQW